MKPLATHYAIILKRYILLTLCLIFNLAAQPFPTDDAYDRGLGQIDDLSGFNTPSPGFLRGSISLFHSRNPQLTGKFNEPHPFPNYLRKFGQNGSFPKYYQQLITSKPENHVQSQVFDEEGFRKVRKIFVQEFENKTHAPNRDETAGWMVAVQMYKELRSSNKFNVTSAPMKEEEGFRMQISADFSKAKPGHSETPAPVSDPLFKEKDLGIVGKGVDAVMIGAVTKFLDHYVDNYGKLRESLSGGVEFGSYLISAKDGKVLWGARYLANQNPDLSNLINANGRWLSKAELVRRGMKQVLKAFYQNKTFP